jgi:hypothetical protein
MAARQTDQSTNEAERETIRRTTDQAARSARTMSDEAQRTVQSGAAAAQRNSERFLTSWRSGADAANQIAGRSLAKFTEMFGVSGDTAREAMQQSSSNVQAMFETTTLIADSLQDLSGEWASFVQARTERNLEHFDRLMRCRSLHEWLASQTDIARDNFEASLQTIRKASERSTRVADEAVRKMSEAPLAPQ